MMGCDVVSEVKAIRLIVGSDERAMVSSRWETGVHPRCERYERSVHTMDWHLAIHAGVYGHLACSSGSFAYITLIFHETALAKHNRLWTKAEDGTWDSEHYDI